MVPLISQNIEAIVDTCKQLQVKSLYLVGSAIDPSKFSEESDVDFLYTFNREKLSIEEYADNYFSLLFFLQDLLDRQIDLIPEEKITNKYFKESVLRNREVIYG